MGKASNSTMRIRKSMGHRTRSKNNCLLTVPGNSIKQYNYKISLKIMPFSGYWINSNFQICRNTLLLGITLLKLHRDKIPYLRGIGKETSWTSIYNNQNSRQFLENMNFRYSRIVERKVDNMSRTRGENTFLSTFTVSQIMIPVSVDCTLLQVLFQISQMSRRCTANVNVLEVIFKATLCKT